MSKSQDKPDNADEFMSEVSLHEAEGMVALGQSIGHLHDYLYREKRMTIICSPLEVQQFTESRAGRASVALFLLSVYYLGKRFETAVAMLASKVVLQIYSNILANYEHVEYCLLAPNIYAKSFNQIAALFALQRGVQNHSKLVWYRMLWVEARCVLAVTIEFQKRLNEARKLTTSDPPTNG